MRMRTSTSRTIRRMFRAGSSDSAAAIATTSVPPNATTTMRSAAAMPVIPCGAKPPSSTRFEIPVAGTPGMSPTIAHTPTMRKAMIAATLIAANQNSKRP